MKFFLAIFLVLFLVFSCKNEEKAFEPYCKLTETEMIDVMVDFSIVKSMKSIARKDLKDSGIKPYEYLFIRHGVDSIVIRENLKYYNLDLEKAKKLYDTVKTIINARSEKVQVILDEIEEDRKEKDSIGEDVNKASKIEKEDERDDVYEVEGEDEKKAIENDSLPKVKSKKTWKKKRGKKLTTDGEQD